VAPGSEKKKEVMPPCSLFMEIKRRKMAVLWNFAS
jgi:hypothetical protein